MRLTIEYTEYKEIRTAYKERSTSCKEISTAYKEGSTAFKEISTAYNAISTEYKKNTYQKTVIAFHTSVCIIKRIYSLVSS